MLKTEAIKTVLDAAAGAPVILTTGFACRMAHALGDRPGSFYMTGSMGLAAAVGAGIAAETGRRVVVLDGDGSLLMNASVLCTIGAAPRLPVTHIVLDDGRYASTGGQATPARRCDFQGLALAAGYPLARAADSPAELAKAVRLSLAGDSAPELVHCRLAPAAEFPGPRIDADLREHAGRFRAYLRAGPW